MILKKTNEDQAKDMEEEILEIAKKLDKENCEEIKKMY